MFVSPTPASMPGFEESMWISACMHDGRRCVKVSRSGIATARPASQSSTLCPAFGPGRSILGEMIELGLIFCDKNRYAMRQAGSRTCADCR
ncbi:hypothetical protein KC363_g186 [Hortaea werneckii]|nr:hypothetical protein KC363_g186 [Hortaea werneckii]